MRTAVINPKRDHTRTMYLDHMTFLFRNKMSLFGKNRIKALFNTSCMNYLKNIVVMNYLEDDGMNPVEISSGGRPEEPFSQLIKRAIESSPRQRLFLTEIYTWIQDNYQYYRQADTGWRVYNFNFQALKY